ncbi:MAG: hypothetical protein HY430_00065 [Candidatus Levybacteria bacterium]|nr:hypothetical protein [Candidatus Levybacteria bacterium]
MEYDSYYQLEDLVSLGTQEYAYRRAFGRLKSGNPLFLSEDTPLTFVLGGFHPAVPTPENFLALTREIHPHPDDTHIFMDQNLEPLFELTNPNRLMRLQTDHIPTEIHDYYHRKQAQLEDMRFHESVDVLILDRTLDFLDDEQVRAFAKSASEALTRNGVVLATIKDPILPRFISQWKGKLENTVPQHYRSPKKLQQLTDEYLQTILIADSETLGRRPFYIVGLARKDSDFQPFIGNPTGFTQY